MVLLSQSKNEVTTQNYQKMKKYKRAAVAMNIIALVSYPFIVLAGIGFFYAIKMFFFHIGRK